MTEEKTAACVSTLEKWGYKVKKGKTVGGDSKTYFSGTDEERLSDFQSMLDDKEVNAVMCARGGYGMGRIIEQINFKKFKKHPKWIIGYSDVTVLHSHVYTQYGISTIHAPMASAFNDGGAENEFVQSLKNVLAGKKAKYSCGEHAFNRKGEASGELIGGNLAILAHLTGTDDDINPKGKILFIEDVGEYTYNLDRMMYQLKRSGKFSKLAGLIIGGFTDMKDTERPFGKTAYEIVKDLIDEYDYPVCFGFPVSHADENYALKIGVEYKLKVSGNKSTLQEK